MRGFTRHINRDSTDQGSDRICTFSRFKGVTRVEGFPMEVQSHLRGSAGDTDNSPMPRVRMYRPSIPGPSHKAEWVSRRRSRVGPECGMVVGLTNRREVASGDM